MCSNANNDLTGTYFVSYDGLLIVRFVNKETQGI